MISVNAYSESIHGESAAGEQTSKIPFVQKPLPMKVPKLTLISTSIKIDWSESVVRGDKYEIQWRDENVPLS